jgi:uncharacterized protein YjiK
MTIHVSFAVQRPQTSLTNSIDLSRYKLISSFKVEGVDDDLSGITLSTQSETLFTVINSPPKVL